MKLLVLGGTLFLGRHVVEAALERGDEVTLFTRGQTNPDLYPGVERVTGDRDGDLSALAGREWDAVVDPSGYVPRVVRTSAELLSGAVGHYTFVSSISAYRDFAVDGIDEGYATGEAPEGSEDVDAHYGPLKAASERAAEASFDGPLLVVRAGLIVGPYDWTNRLGWWLARVARGGDVLVPDDPDWRMQLVDGRDLADWMLAMAERREGGVFNATSEPLAMRDVLEEVRRATGSDARFVPVDEGFLLEHGVAPFDHLPLWLPARADPDYRGFSSVDVTRAYAAGLRPRPIAETVRDALAWGEADYGPEGLASGLAPEREAELLKSYHGRHGSP
jgi:2'-hydroxyisoflavone reductase